MRIPDHILLATALLVAFAGLGTPAWSGDAPPAATRKNKAGGAETIRSVAEVVAVDERARWLALKRDDGNAFGVTVAPSVRIFPQIRVGDFVVAEYGRAQIVTLRKTEAAIAGNGAEETLSNPRAIVADIIAIDDKKGFATFKGGKGHIVDAFVKDRQILAQVKIGDRVRVEYLDAVATTVKPARTRR